MAQGDERRVRQWFAAHGGRFGLAGAGIACAPVLSPGGFTNRSFHVHDGRRHVHVKLLDHPGCPWPEVHRRLERSYHVPRLMGVLEGGAMAGEAVALIFEHIPGRPLHVAQDTATTRAVLRTVAELHADGILGAAIGPVPERTCADELVETYVERFRADLEGIEPVAAQLPFLPAGFCGWARAESTDLAVRARTDPALAAPARAVVHGDLHGGNVLVGERGEWWLLDWDDLHGGGDPAVDVLLLLWPLLRAGRGLDLVGAYPNEDLLSRLPLYRRAMLLDEVVDTVADWVEADAMPDHRDMVRRLKQAQHAEALAAYLREYGPGPGWP